ncbi:sugar transferase [Chitinophaga costaii]|nr:sugar transferase [Chitinophaga costaii]
MEKMESFISFLQRSHALRHVPLFLYKEEISMGQREQIRKLGRVDDILVGTTTTAAFQEKLEFANRLHAHAIQAAAEKRLRNRKAFSRAINMVAKRTFDIVCAGTLLLLASPIMLIIAILIRLESKGPIFYVAHRAGCRYRVFQFYKFRTMVVGADKQVEKMQHLNGYGEEAGDKGPMFFKLANDPRVTRLGAFLRNTSLDELPQLLNVILGDMSLVGNRPLPLYEAASLTTDHHAGRFLAPAGITGLWQIKKRGTKSMSVGERIDLDIDYAEKHSFLYDMWIIANTPSALIQKENV